ncbi:MAG: hypothetical protein LBI05_11310, partial [Planctomycetaceae bacterium]|nr:hypothetical protein [Planctomycetaceae bacterium]
MEKSKLLIIAGPNGSGKTSVTSKILKHEWIEGCEYINPDNIARDVFGDWNSPDEQPTATNHCPAMTADISLCELQELIRKMYYEKDAARGA